MLHRLSAARTLAWPSRVFSFSLKHITAGFLFLSKKNTSQLLSLSQTHHSCRLTLAGFLSLSQTHHSSVSANALERVSDCQFGD
jgi:hypothetical protein